MNAEKRTELIKLAEAQGDLAVEVGADRSAIERWQRSGHGLKRNTIRAIEYLADGERRRAALAQSGLRECEWAEAFEFPADGTTDDTLRAAKALKQHAAECSSCLQRQRFLEQRFGPQKKPYGPVLGAVAGLATVVFFLPRALRPAAAGAVLVGGIILVRVLFALPFLVSDGDWRGLAADFVVPFSAALAAGASGGLLYSATRPGTELLGRATEYVSGIIAVAGYMGAMVLLGPYAFGEELIPISDSFDLWIVGIVTIVLGLALGHGMRSAGGS